MFKKLFDSSFVRYGGDEALIASILKTTAQRQLFARMPPNDRQHALAVVRALQQASHGGSVLLQAALLHDVAKSLGMPIFHRVAIVGKRRRPPPAILFPAVRVHTRQ